MKQLRNKAPEWLKGACDHISTVDLDRGCNIIKHGWNQLYLEFALDPLRQRRALVERTAREEEATAAAKEDAIATAAMAAALADADGGAHAMEVGRLAGIAAGAAAVAALTALQHGERQGRYVGLSAEVEELCAIEREFHESELPTLARLQQKGKPRASRKSSDAVRAAASRQVLAEPSDSDAESDHIIHGEPSIRRVMHLVSTGRPSH
jgi:hypothetical protein